MRKITIRNDRFLILLIITTVFEPPRPVAQPMVVIAIIFYCFIFLPLSRKVWALVLISYQFLIPKYPLFIKEILTSQLFCILETYTHYFLKKLKEKNIVFFQHERIQILLFSFGSENNSCVCKKARTIFTKRSPMLFDAQKKSIQLVIENCAINGKRSDDFQEISFFGE